MITGNTSDDAVLADLGQRLAQRRIALAMTQAHLAGEAGVAKRTVERIESGGSAQMSTFIRILRVLELLDGVDRLVPEEGPRPMDLLKLKGKVRRRAPRKRESGVGEPRAAWSWGDDT